MDISRRVKERQGRRRTSFVCKSFSAIVYIDFCVAVNVCALHQILACIDPMVQEVSKCESEQERRKTDQFHFEK